MHQTQISFRPNLKYYFNISKESTNASGIKKRILTSPSKILQNVKKIQIYLILYLEVKVECEVPSWEGDSLCDDENNTEECNWDGGDCCPPNDDDFWNFFCEVSFRNTVCSSALLSLESDCFANTS